MKQNKVKNPKQIHIKAESALLFIDETVAFKKGIQRLTQIRKQYTGLKSQYKGKGFIDDKLKVTTTPIF